MWGSGWELCDCVIATNGDANVQVPSSVTTVNEHIQMNVIASARDNKS